MRKETKDSIQVALLIVAMYATVVLVSALWQPECENFKGVDRQDTNVDRQLRQIFFGSPDIRK